MRHNTEDTKINKLKDRITANRPVLKRSLYTTMTTKALKREIRYFSHASFL